MNETDPHKRMAAALGRIPSGLFILTACNGDESTGMLASWVQQCSFEPPLVSIVVQSQRPLIAWLSDEAPFVVNVLDSTQTDMIAHFGRGFAPGAPAFNGLEIERSKLGPAILSEALAYLEGRIVNRLTVGDHDLFIGRIVGGAVLSDGQPMVHVRKSGLHY